MNALRSHAALIIAALLVAAVLPLAQAAEVIREPISSDAVPALVSKDFGSVLEGQEVVLELVVSNAGSARLEVGAVKPLCGCMTADAVDGIEPGKQGIISFRLETAGYVGPTKEAGLVQWVDTPIPVTRIEMLLDVQPVLEVSPGRILRFRTTAGTQEQQLLELRSHSGEPFTVTKVETSKPFLQAKVSGEGAVRQLTITLDGTAPTGLLRETVTVHTDLEAVPTVEIKIAGVVKPAA